VSEEKMSYWQQVKNSKAFFLIMALYVIWRAKVLFPYFSTLDKKHNVRFWEEVTFKENKNNQLRYE
jgi:hypothetical protein